MFESIYILHLYIYELQRNIYINGKMYVCACNDENEWGEGKKMKNETKRKKEEKKKTFTVTNYIMIL